MADEADNHKYEKKMAKLEKNFKFNYEDRLNLTKDERHKIKSIKKFDKIMWYTTAATLVEGQSFGELALLRNSKRAATVQSQTTVELAALSRADYYKVLRKIELK